MKIPAIGNYLNKKNKVVEILFKNKEPMTIEEIVKKLPNNFTILAELKVIFKYASDEIGYKKISGSTDFLYYKK